MDNVRKTYGDLVAVDGLSLHVQKGEVLGLLGPNGAGKSTTVNLSVGLLRPTGGTIAIAGGNPAQPAVRRGLGVAPQALALYDMLSGAENLRFFGEVYGLAGAALSQRVAWALDFVALTDRARDRVSTYSGGMKRRLNLAAALVHDPKLILLDEPTVGVDPQSRNQIFDNILALKALGRTLIYTTHYMEEAARLCDRVAIIDKGKLLAIGTVPELLEQHGARPTLVVQTSSGEQRLVTTDPLGELNRLAAVGTVRSFHLEQATLEQVFLHLTGRSLRD
ncbi:MAG TPA: ABC transporter ATP-binding protein [Vicinamibacterales bacterium]|nr:ABC transporter ATP-binding protein [Vicinamibacterales bacterium]